MTAGKELICEVPFVFHLRALSDLYNVEYKKSQEYAIRQLMHTFVFGLPQQVKEKIKHVTS